MDDVSGTERARTLARPPQWKQADRPDRAAVATVTIDVGGAQTPGLLLPARHVSKAAGVLLLVLGVVFLAGAGVLAYTGFRDGSIINVLGVLLLGGIGVLFAFAGVAALRPTKTGPVGIVLTPEHVVVTWVRPPVVVAWSDIAELRPLSLRLGRRSSAPTQDYLGIAVRDVTAVPGIGPRVKTMAERFGTDLACVVPMARAGISPLVILHLTRHYLANPAARAELSGEVAVGKAREFSR